MTGILKVLTAINTVEGIILPTTGNLHHVIVLTDASAKDDSRYQEVINAANTAKATVHFFIVDHIVVLWPIMKQSEHPQVVSELTQ